MISINQFIRKCTLIVLITISQFLFSQPVDEILPNTIIFKLKESERAKSNLTTINHPDFIQFFTEVGGNNLAKIFPNKTKEDIPGFVDLSLIYELSYSKNLSVNTVIKKLQKLKITDYVEPYYLPQVTYTPSDTLLVNQYYIGLINAENAWGINKGDTNIVIGITDTGWDPTHPDLLGNVKINYADPINGNDDDSDGYIDNYMGWDLGMDDNDALWESLSHGVNVNGIAAAVTDNVTGIAGVGFKTRFLPIKISNSVGQLTHAYQGIVYAADHGCFIINCSWGGYTPSQFNQSVINYARINKGCLVVAAVGNDNGENVFYPAGYNGVLSVAGSEMSDLKETNSNYGYYVDVSAPGHLMQTTGANGGYGINGGTSMAAPVISGGAAILKAQFPFYTNDQIAALIQATADDLNALNPSYIDKLGSGRLNLFNGVSASGVQFLELTEHYVTDINNNLFEFGDTLRIEGIFENYLDPISGVTVTLTSTSPYVNIIDGTTAIPNLGVLSSYSNAGDKFIVEVLSGAALNEVVTFKAEITNGTFTNNDYFSVTLNPDYINLDENLVGTTITSNGKIGFNDINNSVGLGFTYASEDILYEAGLMIGDASTRVADVVRGNPGQDQDFGSQQNVVFNPPYKSALDLYNVLDDAPMVTPIDLRIEQFSYAYPSAPDDKYVIVVYNIQNTGVSSLSNLYAGLFADWDIVAPLLNKAGYDASRKMGYVHSLNNDTIYGAIKLLSANSSNNYSLDLDGSGGVDPNGGGYTTAEKYTTLSTSRNSAGGVTGKDVAHVVSTGPINLSPSQITQIAFAIIAGDSLLDIQASADAAQIRYNNDALSIEDQIVDVFKIYPNPTKGMVYLSSAKNPVQMSLKNSMGMELERGYKSQLNISNYPDGVYFIEIISKEGSNVQKVVLVK